MNCPGLIAEKMARCRSRSGRIDRQLIRLRIRRWTQAEVITRLSGSRGGVQEMRIDRPAILEYLRTIAPDKQEIALVHALEVGVIELAMLRERFQR